MLGLGECGGKGTVPVWICVLYPLKTPLHPLGAGQLLRLANLGRTRLAPMWVGPHTA